MDTPDPPMTAEAVDLTRIRADLQSPDDTTRARAVREICPCRLGWEAFQACMVIVRQLQKDPSPIVRKAARHVIEESYALDSGGLPTTRREVTNDMLRRKRQERWRPAVGQERRPRRTPGDPFRGERPAWKR